MRRRMAGGRLIDRTRGLAFEWNGRPLRGLEGDTLASALLANGVALVGRSFKYHRPRGILAAGVEEPNALVGLGRGDRFTPNARATTTPLVDGLVARSQNHWPSLAFDAGAAAGLAARILPAGFYYKTFLAPRAAWKHLFEPAIRRSAGLGAAPTQADPDRYESVYAFCDILVVGAGPAGLAAARAAAGAGARVLLLEQSGWFGGRALVDGGTVAGRPAADWAEAEAAALAALPGLTLRANASVAGINDHGYVLANESISVPGPGERLWRIRATRIVTATGAIERPIAFAGNDRPGVMLAAAVRDYLALWGTAPDRTVIATASDDAYRTALALEAAGLQVPAILDARPEATGPLPAEARARGLRVLAGRGIAATRGRHRLTGVTICAQDGDGAPGETIPCDALAISGGWSPAVHLWSHAGGRLRWDENAHHFAPDPARPATGPDGRPFVIAAGAAAGAPDLASAIASGWQAGRQAAEECGLTPADEAAPPAEAPAEAPAAPVWLMPARAKARKKAKAFIDFQNDVKVSDIELAAREGYASVEHAKRYTTLGMATDQGKTSNVPGLAILAAARGAPIPEIGTTTFRPPWTPVTLGALAAEARGPLFKPTRRTPLDAWHEARGARFEPVGDWRRPYAYPAPGEDLEAAIAREITATRTAAGLLDASTLGKILVRGPDAAAFLDRVYTGTMSTLKPGRCRYGLMCTENGFLFDDGVVARLADDAFLLHTTSGGSDRVHAWLEEWLQTEWWDLRAFTLNLTEQFAQIGVAGPKARDLLHGLGGMDLAGLPFMAFAEGELAGIPARVFRISFTGELSYEIAVPASRGLELWEACLAAGTPLGATPYGTEALHVMRAEKGYIMIGDETDGTVTPQDLGLDWAIGKKKPDYIGKRAQARPDLTREDRLQFVGLLTDDPAALLPEGAHAIGAGGATIGHVTSSYRSPTLGRTIALGLIAGGRARMGETLVFPLEGGRALTARIADPVFYDPEGARQNG